MSSLLRSFFIFLLSIPGAKVQAQDIAGTWVGNYEKVMLMSNPRKLVVEIFLTNDSLISGTSHLYYKNGKYEHYTIHGKYNRQTGRVFFSEDSVLGLKLGFLESNCTGDYFMALSVTDTAMRMKGKWKDNKDKFLGCPTTAVWLEKRIQQPARTETLVPDSVQASTEMVMAPPPALSRKPVFQSLIEVTYAEMDSVRVDLYDNGEVDRDSISLYLNDSLVFDKKMISDKPLSFYLTLSGRQSLSKLKMVAVNQGTIPPCTALMVVTTRRKRYEVSLSSNFESNAVVEFFLKE